jgi:hypothetical protein
MRKYKVRKQLTNTLICELFETLYDSSFLQRNQRKFLGRNNGGLATMAR